MRILIDCRFYGLENAGLGRYTINLVENLIRFDDKNSYILLLRKKYFNELNLPTNFKKILTDIKPYSLKEQLLLPVIVNRENPDLVHYVHFNAPLVNVKPFVVTIHDMIMHKSKGMETTTLNPLAYALKRFVYKFVFKNAVSKSRMIMVPSNAVKTELETYFKLETKKILVTYLGVDYETQKPSIPDREKYLLYVGNAYPHKNLDRLLDAIKISRINLKISTSKGIFSKRLEDKIKEKGVHNLVKILGFVDDKTLKPMYQKSLAFIYPSLIEGFGFQGLEAMSSGTLLLCSDIPVFREIYGDNAIYFDPTNVGSISKAISEVLNIRPSLRHEKINKSQKLTKKYSWERCVKETLNCYKRNV